MTDALPAPATSGPVDQWLDEHGEHLVAMRRHLHAHPELSGEEHETTAAIRSWLREAGIEPRLLSVGTGLVADIRSVGDTRPALALRADIDALAMDDETETSYRSTRPGVAHTCGHDVHTTVVVGAAQFYATHPELLPGPLRLVFQPAEERVPGGALSVIDDQGLAGVGAILGLHCEPKLDVGRVGIRSGEITSAADMVVVRLHGPGGHTARPELTADLITIGARLVTEVPAAVAAQLDHPDDVKMVFGAIHAGDAANAIPTSLELRASVRSPRVGVWERLPQLVGDAIDAVVSGTGAAHEVEYTHGVPPVVNDPTVTRTVRRVAERLLGDDQIVDAEQSWGGDDFAWFTREVPGSYVRLGVHDPARQEHLDLHAGHFDVDERAIGIGVRLLVTTAAEHFRGTT